MKTVPVDRVEVDASGALLVTPREGTDYEHIYRTATGVFWAEGGSLCSPEPRDWTVVQWFERMYSAVRSEYGDRLELSPNTEWINVPPAVRDQILRGIDGLEERLERT